VSSLLLVLWVQYWWRWSTKYRRRGCWRDSKHFRHCQYLLAVWT